MDFCKDYSIALDSMFREKIIAMLKIYTFEEGHTFCSTP